MEVVFIVVAVQNGLNKIMEGLKAKGHEVVDMGNSNNPVDAIVYEGNSFQVSYVSRDNPDYGYGILYINSLGKSIDQIDEMLRLGCYEHLF